MFFLENAWLVPLVPAVSFFVILFFGRRLPKKGSEIGIVAVGTSFVLACGAAIAWIRQSPVAHHAAEVGENGGGGLHGAAEPALREAVERSVSWLKIGDADIRFGIHVDGLTVMMLFVVTAISLLVHIYSTSYMHGDRRYTHFYAALSLFTASMLFLVVSDNTLQLLIGWELVGLCSFLLIGHWWEEKPNSDAALKAFLTTRTGDVGFMIGIIILFFAAGETFNIATLNEMALGGDIRHSLLLIGAIALFCGPIGKSAQFPLHTWLPDAMAGPTPVSALIHAATMVVAGVYVIARCYGVFWAGFSIADGGINLVAAIGGITVIIAALLAFVQDDIKKVLAYSTVSQLGYMVMALGVGAWTAAIFHLFTHAFFKALLFLGAGSVSHAVHSFDMKTDMGGLRNYMPTTYATFMVGSLALAGIFPLAGFWSKDEILLGAAKNGYPLFLLVGVVGAALTAAYMARCVYLTFFGDYRGHGYPHESSPAITVPLIILGVGSVVVGFFNATPFGIEAFGTWTENEVFELAALPHHPFSWSTAALSVAVAAAGITAGWLYYRDNVGPHGLTRRNHLAGWGYQTLVRKYYLDDLYTDGVVGSIKGPVARIAYWTNQKVIDGAVNAVGIGARRAGRVVYDVIDQKVIDGAVNGAGITAEEGGGLLRLIQTGRVQQYAAILFGAVGLFALALVLGT